LITNKSSFVAFSWSRLYLITVALQMMDVWLLWENRCLFWEPENS